MQGVGFDYVLGSGGLYVQSESAHLTARVLAARCIARWNAFGGVVVNPSSACSDDLDDAVFSVFAIRRR